MKLCCMFLNKLEIAGGKKITFGNLMAQSDGEDPVWKQTAAREEVNWMALSVPAQTQMRLLPADKGIIV